MLDAEDAIAEMVERLRRGDLHGHDQRLAHDRGLVDLGAQLGDRLEIAGAAQPADLGGRALARLPQEGIKR